MRQFVGVIGALAVHLLLFTAVFRPFNAPSQLAYEPMPFGAANGSPDGLRITAFLLEGAAAEERPKSDGALTATLDLSPIHLDTDLARLFDSGAEIVESTAENAARGDPSQAESFARMRGIYFSQVHARVDRVWEKPKDWAPTSTDADCMALVLQNTSGAVLEVELAGCPEDFELRESIVRAVFRASPLPAPPDPAVFAQRIRIDFSSSGF